MKLKIGRPRRGEERGELHNINVRLDEETFAALERLESDLPRIRGRRSIALRLAIKAADARRK